MLFDTPKQATLRFRSNILRRIYELLPAMKDAELSHACCKRAEKGTGDFQECASAQNALGRR